MQGIELTPEDPIEEIVSLATIAESNGFDTVFASCHYNNRDPFITLDRIAAETNTVQIGPGVANPYENHPVSLASRIGTLAEVSDGRTLLGLGAGDRSTLWNLGVEQDRPVRRVLESMRVIRTLLTGNRVDHNGTFTARDAGLNYPVPWDIPIYIGAQGPDMIQMSAKHADGVLINATHPRDFEWADTQINQGLTNRTHQSNFDAAAYASVSVAENEQEARRAARPPVAFIAAGASNQVLDRHNIDTERAERLGALIGTGEFHKAFDTVSDRMINAFCVAGTPEQVLSRFDAILDHVDSVVAGAPLGPHRENAIRLLAEVFRQVDS